jgi:hypothetical protein
MSDLPTKAAKYLQDWLVNAYSESSPPGADSVLEMLATVSRLADEDWMSLVRSDDNDDEANFPDQDHNTKKQAVWAVIPAALRAAVAGKDERAVAALTLHDGLVNLSRGVQDDHNHGFSCRSVQSRNPTGDEWNRARVIAALQIFKEKREEILRQGATLLGMNRAGVLKLAENYRGGLVGGEQLRRLVAFAESAISEGDTLFVDDLI